jgi:hypothetical protein
MDDRELNQLLREWKAPDAPTFALRASTSAEASADKSVGKPGAAKPWWRWLLTGSIRIPVPVGVAAAVVLAFWLYSRGSVDEPASVPSTQPVVSLADFKPVEEVEVRIVGEMK